MNDDSHDKFENSASTGVYTTDVLNAEVKEETSTPHLLSKVDYYKISSRPNYLQYNNRSSFQRNDSSEKSTEVNLPGLLPRSWLARQALNC